MATSVLPSSSAKSPTANGYSATQQPQSTPIHANIVRRTAATPGSAASPNPDPYGHLTEKQLELMNEELLAAEAKYAPRFAEAEQIPDENLRRQKIEGLRNSFGTKQSMIRKKFGVRLRERRTKAEIMAEKERLGLKRIEKEKAKPSPAIQQLHTSSPSENVDSSQPRPAGGSGWTAANTPRSNAVWEQHDAKRRRLDASGGYQTPYKSLADDTPSRKTLSVSEMGGGLSGASATAATHDPTLPSSSQPTRVYEQSGARVEIHEPSKSNAQPATDMSAVKTEPRSGTATPTTTGGPDSGVNGRGRRPSPTSEAQVVGVEPSGSSSDDDDEDIPSTLPAHARRGPASGSTSLLQTP